MVEIYLFMCQITIRQLKKFWELKTLIFMANTTSNLLYTRKFKNIFRESGFRSIFLGNTKARFARHSMVLE